MNGLHLDPASWLLAVLLGLAYGLLTRFRLRKGARLYGAGLVLMVLTPSIARALLGDTYGFSTHMIEHITLLLVCAPLLVLGFPANLTGRAAKVIQRFSGFLHQVSWLGWLAGVGVMWLWHLPALFQVLFAQPHGAFTGLRLLHTASLLGAGMLFSWPILGPAERARMAPLLGVLYLFTACVACSLLGLFISFAPVSLYTYPQMVTYAGVTQVICGAWNANQAADQQTAGLIMWVPCCFIYLTGALYLLRLGLMSEQNPQPVLETHLSLPKTR